MIKEKDVRIGNLVMCDGEVYSISPADYAETDFDHMEPIPLTEEWLERVEFQYGETIGKSSDENNDQAWSKQISNLDWLEFQMVKGIDGATKEPVSWPEWRVVNECSYIRQDFWGQPKYLHQLQNLYYALTGEELTIKP